MSDDFWVNFPLTSKTLVWSNSLNVKFNKKIIILSFRKPLVQSRIIMHESTESRCFFIAALYCTQIRVSRVSSHQKHGGILD